MTLQIASLVASDKRRARGNAVCVRVCVHRARWCCLLLQVLIFVFIGFDAYRQCPVFSCKILLFQHMRSPGALTRKKHSSQYLSVWLSVQSPSLLLDVKFHNVRDFIPSKPHKPFVIVWHIALHDHIGFKVTFPLNLQTFKHTVSSCHIW